MTQTNLNPPHQHPVMAVQLPKYIDFIRLSDDRALLTGPATTKELRGKSIGLIEQSLPLLREGTTAADLADTLDISASLAADLIKQLQTTGLLKEETGSHDYWSWASPVLDVDEDSIRGASVAVLDRSDCGLSNIEEYPFNLVPLGSIKELQSALADTDLLLTLTVGENRELHHAIIERLSENLVDWIPAKLTGATVTVGPFGTPKMQGCYNCYDQRRRASTEISPSIVEVIDQRPNQDRTPYSEHVHSFLVHMLLTEAVAALGDGKTPQSSGAVVECDLTQFTMNRREVIPIPGCELCGMS
jgi:bacteriocin biosynthesis cyclodehydratase domain-containing protein